MERARVRFPLTNLELSRGGRVLIADSLASWVCANQTHPNSSIYPFPCLIFLSGRATPLCSCTQSKGRGRFAGKVKTKMEREGIFLVTNAK